MSSEEGITSTPLLPGAVYGNQRPLINTRSVYQGSPIRRGRLGDRRTTALLRESFIARLSNDSFTDHAQMLHQSIDDSLSGPDTGPDIVTIQSGPEPRHFEYTVGDSTESPPSVAEGLAHDLSRQMRDNEQAIREMENVIRSFHKHTASKKPVKRIIKRHVAPVTLQSRKDSSGLPSDCPRVVTPDESTIPTVTRELPVIHPVMCDLEYNRQRKNPSGVGPDATDSDILDLEQQLDVIRYKLDRLNGSSHRVDKCKSMVDSLARQVAASSSPPVLNGGGDTFGHVTTPSSTPKLQKPIAMPESFSGSRSENFNEWVQDFELYAELNSWGDDQKLKFLPICLKGGARRIFSDLKGIKTYVSAVDSLRERFDPKCYSEVHKLNFRRRKRNKNESFFDLALDLRKLAKQAFPAKDQEFLEDLTREQFIEAVQSRELRLRLRRAKLSMLDDMVALCVEHETFDLLENVRGKDAHPVNTTEYNHITCHKCGVLGHKAKQCKRKGNRPTQESGYGNDSRVERNVIPNINWDFLKFPPPPMVPQVPVPASLWNGGQQRVPEQPTLNR